MTTDVPFLLDNFAPVPHEVTVTELAVTGEIPSELSGWYLRNGPNPAQANSGHWFLGDGMVHGVHLQSGRATAYRNRWVQTDTLTKGARLRDAGGRLNLRAGVANTHVVRHAGRTLALVESSYPYELNMTPGHELETVGSFDFDGRLHTPMTAHPKVCPRTGELHFFGYGAPEHPYLTYHLADADGVLQVSRPVDVAASTMMHDFYLSADHVIFMDLPMVFDLQRARNVPGGMPFCWTPNYGARLGVLNRNDPYGPVRWFEIAPCYVFHTLNAHEEDGRIVLHAVRYDSLADGVTLNGQGSLWRWTIDLAGGIVREEQLDDHAVEFPRIDDRLAGLPSRYGHASTSPTPGDAASAEAAIHRFDLRSAAVTSHRFAPGRSPGEAAFAADSSEAGGPGWLLTFVYDQSVGRSELVILDAQHLEGDPVARVHLPRRVPAGFHGNWLPTTT